VIEGEVTPERKGVVRLQVSRPGSPSAEVDAVIDTGFTGFLALPTDEAINGGHVIIEKLP
jgi:predicted aspartyl protease